MRQIAIDRNKQTQALTGIRPSIAQMPENGIVEVAKHGWGKPGLIPLWFGEGDLPSPAVADEAAIAALRAGETRYGPTRGTPATRAAIAAYVSRLHGRTISDERITLTAGGMQAILLAMQMLVDPGDEVVILHPLWPNAVSAVSVMGGVPVCLPLERSADGWTLDMDKLMAACGPNTSAIYINTPNNPTGWVMSRGEMTALLDFARQRGLWIISDEVYGRLTYDGSPAPSFLDLIEAEERVLVVDTHSKTWAMTGWRLGWLVSPPSLGPVCENLMQFSTTGVPAFLQAGAAAAVAEGEDQYARVLALCSEGRRIVGEALNALPRIGYVAPAGAFYSFFSVEGEPDSRALAIRLIEQAGVGLAPGRAFGAGGEGHLRLCFACSAERLGEAMARLSAALA